MLQYRNVPQTQIPSSQYSKDISICPSIALEGVKALYIYKGNAIQSEVDPSLNHVMVACFVPISCPELANQQTWLVRMQ